MAAYKERVARISIAGSRRGSSPPTSARPSSPPFPTRAGSTRRRRWPGSAVCCSASPSSHSSRPTGTALPKLARFALAAGVLPRACRRRRLGGAQGAARRQQHRADDRFARVRRVDRTDRTDLRHRRRSARGVLRRRRCAALALALAGRSSGAATVGLIFIALGDFTDRQWFSGLNSDAPWMLFAAPLGAYLALRWSSAPLAHVSALAIIYCFGWFAARVDEDAGVLPLPVHRHGRDGCAAHAGCARKSARSPACSTVGSPGPRSCSSPSPATCLGSAARDSDTAGIIHRIVWLGCFRRRDRARTL